MKLKWLLVGSCAIFFIFLIYLTTLDKKVYYVALGDFLAKGIGDNQYSEEIQQNLEKKGKLEKYVEEFMRDDMRTTDYIKMIEENETRQVEGKTQTLKNALIKADLLTLSIGNNDLLYGLGMYNNEDIYTKKELEEKVDGVMKDIEKLFELLREYCKEDIIITGFYQPQNLSEQKRKLYLNANRRLERLAKKYKITYVEVDKILDKEGNLDASSMLPTKRGYLELSQKMKDIALNLLLEEK